MSTHNSILQQLVDALSVAITEGNIELIEALSKAYQRLAVVYQ